MISIISDANIDYPTDENWYSPSYNYPEYTFGHVASKPNRVYDAVRECYRQTGLDIDRYGTPHWNPLSQWVREGQQVFVLCNFVFHRRHGESRNDFLGKCTHGSVIRAVVDYILLAVGQKGKVYIGNAPLQSCSWKSVLRETGAAKVIEFYQRKNLPVEAADLRLLVAERGLSGRITQVQDHSALDAVHVRLDSNSLLSAFDPSNARFRVLDYNPVSTESFHRDGAHTYVLNRKVVASDLIFSIPKLKTHEKVGITCAIKGCVGAVGHKECLAHHRFGSSALGGDEYPTDPWGFRQLLSYMHDSVQRTGINTRKGQVLRIIDRLIRRAVRPLLKVSSGAWFGNDTCWRMAVDLARMLSYARADGTIAPKPVRHHLALVDGVVGGEGEGPLAPKARHSGTLIFGDNPVPVDHAAAILMGYDPSIIPIVRESAHQLGGIPLIDQPLSQEPLIYNGKEIAWEDLKNAVSYRFLPPRGWRGVL